ncbi:transmembrane emp24 domain-containing protein 6-like [Diretmus argenteus]
MDPAEQRLFQKRVDEFERTVASLIAAPARLRKPLLKKLDADLHYLEEKPWISHFVPHLDVVQKRLDGFLRRNSIAVSESHPLPLLPSDPACSVWTRRLLSWLMIQLDLISENQQKKVAGSFTSSFTVKADQTMQPAAMLVYVLCVVTVSHGAWARKSEPSLGEADPGLFRGSDRYNFAIEVPASGMECFWHFAHQSGSFYLTYMVQLVTGMAMDHRLLVTILSPDGALMASVNDATGHINFQTEVTGFYQMCLGNHKNQFGGVRVFLNFGIIYEGFEEAERETEEGERVLNSTLSSIEESTQKLQAQIFHMWRHYNYARMRKGKDHHLLLSNLSYVTWWSAAQSLVILLSGYLQLLFLKRLFRTDSHRPRC